MCGIVGFINNKKCENIIIDMLKIQSYRGPDDCGIYYDDDSGVHFGHNRLAIQDLSSCGHQPFISDCENYIIVFNGEIYNFKIIREELEVLGYKFISSSDTEVILYSYKEWGIKCLNKFIGMFAFSLLDKMQNKLFLVRDRAGVKPLYYYTENEQFLFSSEIKSFHKHPKFLKEENIEVLPYFFQFGYIPAPHTIFKNCFKLEAGHYLIYDIQMSKIILQKYWDVNDFYLKEKHIKSEEEITKDVEEILDDACSLRMISDVPVGVFLSGGYDSTIVATLLAKKQGRKINTFTIGFEDQNYNEAIHAKEIAKYLGTNHIEYYMKNKDMLELIKNIPFYYDEPFGDSSALPTMIVSKLAKQKVTVALSADGGDEIFCGYSKYFFLNKVQSIFSNNFKRNILKSSLRLLSPGAVELMNDKLPRSLKQSNIKDKFLKFRRAISSSNLEEMFQNASSYIEKDKIKRFIKINKKQEMLNKWNKIDNIEFLEYMMANDYKLFLSDDVLVKVDRATMSVSLEGREPLLDHRIIEYMAKVPLSLKYRNNQGKYLLRKILYKYIPKELVDKPKSGFQIPLNEWLRNELKPLVLQYLDTEKMDSHIFNVEEINILKEKFFSGEEIGTIIWFLLMYQMWKEKWID